MHELADRLLSQLKGIWRYRWYAVVISWIIALGGWIAVYLMPDRYEATARVYVDTKTVLRPLLAGLAVQPNVDEMVTMMSRTLITRPNIARVIQMAELDVELMTSKDREKMITRLMRDLTIRSAGRENLYTIAYTDNKPQVAKRLVQSLLTIFVEGSIGDQRKDTDAAQRFIEAQLKAYNDKLIAAENAVTEFKRRNMGLMAGERRDYYGRLVDAQSKLSEATLALKEAEDSRDAIKEQLAGASEEFPSLLGDMNVDEGANPEIDVRIQTLERKLDDLRLNYTEQHPDIVAAVRIIARLKEEKKAEAKVKKPPRSAAKAEDPVARQRTVLLASADANVAALKARVAEFRKRFNALKATANAVPQVEAEYTQLTRDYEVTKGNYRALLARLDKALITGDMESSASVMAFRVIDPPEVPSVPKAPNRPLLMSLVLLAALGGGLGGALLISEIRPTFNDERSLKEVSGLPVLGAVVMAWTDAHKARRMRGLVALVISFASLLSAYAAIMVALLAASRA
ncbi:MAG: chain length-determining protein [Gammaproteobacteria bacterium]|nr:chain length-determining protein [Gammaproteobacteria bacterium]